MKVTVTTADDGQVTAHATGYARRIPQGRLDEIVAGVVADVRAAAVPAPRGPDPEELADELQEPDRTAGEDHTAEWALVAAAQAGDQAAFGELYRRYRGTVYNFVHGKLRDHHLAEDITSETFARAWRRLGSVTYQGRSFVAWLFTIARNLIFDHCKSSRVKNEMLDGGIGTGVYDPGSTATMRAGRNNVLEWETLHAARELLTPLLAGMNDLQRDVLMRRFWLGEPIAEVADAIGCNVNAVKAVQHRAVERCRDRLRRYGGPEAVSAVLATAGRRQ